MWFARLFGGRDDGSDDELPTAAAPQRPVIETSANPPQPVQNGAKIAPRKPKGFDPYNSGQFERRNAWERIGKR
jgi:hypothetical protein